MCVHIYTHRDMHTHCFQLFTPHTLPPPWYDPCHTHTFQEVIVVLDIIHPDISAVPILPPEIGAFWCPGGVGGEPRDEKQRSWGRPFPLWLGPLLALLQRLLWLLVAFSQASCKLGWECLQLWGPDAAAPVGLSLWEIYLLFIVLCVLPGKAVICVYMCTYTHTHVHIVYVDIYWAGQNP